jgi:DNA-binding MarR family transcriptional regulator
MHMSGICQQVIAANKLGAFAVLLADTLESAYGALSPSAASLLLTLYSTGNATATALAKVAGISQPTAVRVLDGLVRQGFIERKSHTGRTTLLRMTRAGRARAVSLQAARLGAMKKILSGLNTQERATFERFLDKILVAATTSRAFARTVCRLCDHRACDGPLCPIGTRASEIEQSVDIRITGDQHVDSARR